MLKFTREELYNIRLCYECYKNANQFKDNWFTMPCENPHLLVWAKYESYPYWPAKLMSMNDNNKVDVRFFGVEHKRTVLPAKDCYMYSLMNPSLNIGKHKAELEAAQEVS